MVLQEIRKFIPPLLLTLYGRMLRKEYHLITIGDLTEMERKLSCEAQYLKCKIENLNQKHVMYQEILDSLRK